MSPTKEEVDINEEDIINPDDLPSYIDVEHYLNDLAESDVTEEDMEIIEAATMKSLVDTYYKEIEEKISSNNNHEETQEKQVADNNNHDDFESKKSQMAEIVSSLAEVEVTTN